MIRSHSWLRPLNCESEYALSTVGLLSSGNMLRRICKACWFQSLGVCSRLFATSNRFLYCGSEWDEKGTVGNDSGWRAMCASMEVPSRNWYAFFTERGWETRRRRGVFGNCFSGITFWTILCVLTTLINRKLSYSKSPSIWNRWEAHSTDDPISCVTSPDRSEREHMHSTQTQSSS